MKNIFLYHALSALFVGGMTLSAVSCADDDLGENTNNGDKGAVVQFNVGDAQEEAADSTCKCTTPQSYKIFS